MDDKLISAEKTKIIRHPLNSAQSQLARSRILFANLRGRVAGPLWRALDQAAIAGERRLSAAITERLGSKYRIRVQSSPELVGYFAGRVRDAFSALYLMDAIIFLLVLVGIGDTLAAGVVERTREFGLMRAVGLHRSRLFQIVMLEGAAIGVLGLVLAFAAGLALGIFWVQVQFPAILGWTLELHFPTVFALVAAAVAAALCLLGSLVPSGRAARLSVPAALRYE